MHEGIYAVYTQGHSPRFLLMHHEKETEDLNTLFVQLKDSIDKSDFSQVKKLVVQSEQKATDKEREFYKLSVEKTNRELLWT